MNRGATAGLIYLLTIGVALVWGAWAEVDLLCRPGLWAFPRPVSLACAVALGLAYAFLIVRITRLLVKRSRWALRLHRTFRELLYPLNGAAIAGLAIASGVAEELLFRGAMQGSLGWALTTIFFGIAHVPPSRSLIPWTLSALVVGAGFGALYLVTGELLAPVVAHVVINHENLHFLMGYDPDAGSASRSNPGLVGMRATRSAER